MFSRCPINFFGNENKNTKIYIKINAFSFLNIQNIRYCFCKTVNSRKKREQERIVLGSFENFSNRFEDRAKEY